MYGGLVSRVCWCEHKGDREAVALFVANDVASQGIRAIVGETRNNEPDDVFGWMYCAE